MKTAAFAILSLAAVASGFTPAQQFGQRSTALYADIKTGSVKWCVPGTSETCAKALKFLKNQQVDVCQYDTFDTAKGFGFIVPDDGSNDVFVHQTAIKAEGFRSLAEGESVEFKTTTDANGKTKAVDVTGPDGSDVQGAPYNANKGYDEW